MSDDWLDIDADSLTQNRLSVADGRFAEILGLLPGEESTVHAERLRITTDAGTIDVTADGEGIVLREADDE